jgi:uncharacterized ubiquitin-like protein YukD
MTGFPLDNAYITAENNLAVSDEQAIRQVILDRTESRSIHEKKIRSTIFCR